MKASVFFAFAAVAGLAVCGAASGQDKPQKPDWVVKDLYVENTVGELNPDEYFAKDLAEALKADKTAAPRAVAMDYRFDSPGPDGGALDFATDGLTDTRANIRADFLLKGKPRKILYTVCKQDDGKWRIADIQAPGKWTLRQSLKLPETSGC